MMRILVTGANGFIGRHLCGYLSDAGYGVRRCLRHPDVSGQLPESDIAIVGGIGASTDWGEPLSGISAVIHLAARVHVMRDKAKDPLAEFRAVNGAGTERLARQAAEAGVKRFVYVSSIKVNGEETGDRAFSEDEPPAPQCPYGQSKWEAEQLLHRIERETGLAVVIVRPPLVYGPGVGGNFFRMMKLISRGVPLPLGSVENRRSFVNVWNLCSLLENAITRPEAAGETFLAADGEDISTAELVRRLADGLGRKVRLVPLPVSLLASAARLVGKGDLVKKLMGSLQVDNRKAVERLGWHPVVSLGEGLRRTAEWYRETSRAT